MERSEHLRGLNEEREGEKNVEKPSNEDEKRLTNRKKENSQVN